MTVLVTGATGFIGFEVARQLSDAGASPRLMFRRRARAATLAPLNGELVLANLDSEQSLRRALEGVEAVIHLAGRATFEPYRVVKPTLVDGTARLARLAVDAGVSAFVFGSSAMVYAGSSETIDQTTSAHPPIGYGRAKLEAEQHLDAITSESGMRTVALRLPHVYGPGSILFEFIRRRIVPFGGDLESTFSHLQVSDAAAALIAAVDSDLSGAHPISDYRPVEWREFFAVAQEYQPGVRVLDVPGSLAERALRAIERFRAFRRPTMIAADTIAGWRLDQAIDSSATWMALGTTPTHESVASGIPATLETALVEGWKHSLVDFSR